MKSKRHGYLTNGIKIYHHKLNLEYENNTTYLLITEMINGEPKATYYYKIPDNYKDNSLLGETA